MPRNNYVAFNKNKAYASSLKSYLEGLGIFPEEQTADRWHFSHDRPF